MNYDINKHQGYYNILTIVFLKSVSQCHSSFLNLYPWNFLLKAFLERAVIELVYKFNEKSTTSVRKGESTAKVPFLLFGGHNIHTRRSVEHWTRALPALG